jgi:hypothetical protein
MSLGIPCPKENCTGELGTCGGGYSRDKSKYYPRFKCNTCKKVITYGEIKIPREQLDEIIDSVKDKKININGNEKENSSFEQGNDFINIVCASERMLSKEDIIRKFSIDLTEWEIERFKVKTSEGYRKDRSVIWKVSAGKVTTGDVNDSGKMLVVPLYHVEVRFIKKKIQVALKTLKQEMMEECKKFSFKYANINYVKVKEKFMLEPDIPDLHFGKQTWREESGEDYDIKIAEKIAVDTIDDLLSQTQYYSFDKILFPIGNDYFNVNSKLNTTVNNTAQDEDTRSAKTFVAGRKLAIKMIDRLSLVAPVDVIIVPGNHDEERVFYMGDALECWYHNCKNVTVNNKAMKRKYYSYGKNLIGFTHGSEEKLEKLPLIMSLEQKELWASSTFREWQTGDKHHKEELKTSMREKEIQGVMVRILKSLTASDAWHFSKGFLHDRGAEAFVRHFDRGLVAQFLSILQ